MTRIVWDQTGDKYYETGVKKGTLYPQDKNGSYPKGVAWNGLTAVTESPSGAEPTDLYADDIKYGTLRSAETFGCTIEAYTYPDEFAECDGSAEPTPGVRIGQQPRKSFGFVYQTSIGSDTLAAGDAYYLHLVYNCTASPSEKAYATINDSPEAITFSWEINTTAVNVEGYSATSTLTIDSRKVDAEKLTALEDALFGTDKDEPHLPSPDEVIEMMLGAATEGAEGDEGDEENIEG